MSRIGRLPIDVPSGVTVKVNGSSVNVKGPKGELSRVITEKISVKQDDGTLTIERANDERMQRALHGLTRTLVNNMVVGVTEGFKKVLLIEGVGYRAEKKGSVLLLNLGYSHPIYFAAPSDINIDVPSATRIEISGVNKETVGQVAAKIRSFRKPEPYKGKGIRYEGEVVRRKAGKTGK